MIIQKGGEKKEKKLEAREDLLPHLAVFGLPAHGLQRGGLQPYSASDMYLPRL